MQMKPLAHIGDEKVIRVVTILLRPVQGKGSALSANRRAEHLVRAL
jgi:hypothetical protein